jgi:hypothetical protein
MADALSTQEPGPLFTLPAGKGLGRRVRRVRPVAGGPGKERSTSIRLAAVAALVVSAQAMAEVAIWVETPGTMILPDRPAGAVKDIVLVGVRNGTCSAQVALRAGQDGGQTYSFDWTELSGAPGRQIARQNVRLFRAADITVNHGQKVDPAKDRARARTYGSFPDALVPLIGYGGENVANSIQPAKDKSLAFWVDVPIPPDAAAGAYTGRIVLKQGAAETAAVACSS